MFNITDYLKRVSTLIQSEKMGKQEIIDAVFETINFRLPENTITIKHDTVYITVPSAVKSEIMLQGAKIILRIKEKNPTSPIQIIR